MKRVVVVANPVASQFTGGAHRDVMAVLAGRTEVNALWPRTSSEATQAAADAAKDGAGVVVAMGGDGMVHHVAQGLVGTGASLGIVAAGTTNVVARILSIPRRPTRAARLIASDEHPIPLDTVHLILTRGDIDTSHHALFSVGFGFDALVVKEADSDPYRKYRFGSLHYAKSALRVGLRSFPGTRPHLRLVVGDTESTVAALMAQFREVYTYFGRIPLRVSGEPPNPMTLLTLERLRRRRIPRIAWNVLTGRDLRDVDEIEIWPDVEKALLTADPPVAVQADGEDLGMVDAATLAWEPGSLSVIAGSR